MARIYGELRRRGPFAQKALLILLRSTDASIRLNAACYALDFEPNEGEQTLRVLQQEPGLLGFTAQKTLEHWHKGEILFSWVK